MLGLTWMVIDRATSLHNAAVELFFASTVQGDATIIAERVSAALVGNEDARQFLVTSRRNCGVELHANDDHGALAPRTLRCILSRHGSSRTSEFPSGHGC